MTPTIIFEATPEDGRPLARELICTIWPLTDAGDQSQSTQPVVEQRSVLIGSAGPDSGRSEVSLPKPGNYLVDLGFPNGRRTRRSVTVSGEEPYRFLVSAKRYASSSLAKPQSGSSLLSSARVLMSAARSVVSVWELEVKLASPQSPGPTGLRGLRAFLKKLERGGADSVVLNRRRGVDLSFSLEIESAPSGADTRFRSADYRRAWLLVNGQGEDSTVVPFPSGWTADPGVAPFLLSTRRKGDSGIEATKWSVSLQMNDPSYGSLVEYLARRDLRSSALVSETLREQAQGHLNAKNLNPFLAAAAAYMLAMGDDVREEQQQWMMNLTQRFPWLPDGPIAAGYRLLSRSEKGSADFEAGRDLLFEASDRGLPYFSVGLALLTEALNFIVLAEPSNQDAQAHRAAAIAADLACVRNEAFCTLQTSRYYRIPQASDSPD